MTRSPDARLLDLVGDVQGLLDIDEFRHGVLDAVESALPSDYVSLNDVGPDPDSIAVLVRPELTEEEVKTFAKFAHQNPLVQRYLATRDGRAYRFSDVVTRDELHALDIYRELYARVGVEYQLAFTLPNSPDRILAIALTRRTHDYTDAERDFVNRARPFLIQAYRNAVAHERLRASGADDPQLVSERLQVAGLTPRESDVVRLVALGNSNRDIAAQLGVSERTVAKHLERCFKKLGVPNRSAAAARVRRLAEREARLGLV